MPKRRYHNPNHKPCYVFDPDINHPDLHQCSAWLPFINYNQTREFNIITGEKYNITNGTWKNDTTGYRITFDGINGYIPTPYPTSYPFTVTQLAYFDTSVDKDNEFTFSDNTETNTFLVCRLISSVPEYRVNVSSTSGGHNYIMSTTNISTGLHCIALVCHSATDRRIYINGIEEATDNRSAPIDSYNRGYIGRLSRSSGEVYYPCSGVYDFRIYNKGLTAEEVMHLYQNPYSAMLPIERRFHKPVSDNITLNIANLSSTRETDAINIAQTHGLNLADLLSNRLLDAITLTAPHTLTLSDLTQSSEIDAINIAQTHGLNLADLLSNRLLDAITLSSPDRHTLTLSDLTQSSEIDAINIAQTHGLNLADLLFNRSLPSILINNAGLIRVIDARLKKLDNSRKFKGL